VPTREAACHCGQLTLAVEGDPFVVSICHCLACQRRTGSAFGMQAAFTRDQIEISGRYNGYTRVSDEADQKPHVFHFCPDCGSQVFYTEEDDADLVVVSVGSFADPDFPPPTESGYNSRRHRWLGLPDGLVREATIIWDEVRPLYQAGDYAAAADRGRELAEANPDPELFYNLACVESLAGRKDDAIAHLGIAMQMYDGIRDMAAHDADFDPVRDEPGFQALLAKN
jgi:hypothetical protein